MFWHKKYSICGECQVHFEPTSDHFSNLCLTHRKPKLELLARQERVIAWAKANWKKLELQMIERR